MHRRLPILVCALLAVGGPAAAQTEDAARGASLLADARKALGGAEKLAAVKRLQLNGTSRRAAGNNSIEGDLEILIELPDKYRRNETLEFGGGGQSIERVEVLNGQDAWEENSGGGGFTGGGFRGGRGGFGGGRGFGGDAGQAAGGGPAAAPQGAPQIDPERLREAQRRARQADFSRLLLAVLLTTDAPAAWVGTAQSPDGTADVIEVKPANGVPMRLFLDSASHMPLMITWQGAAPAAGGGRRGRAGGQGGAPQAGAAGPAQPAGDSQPQARRGGAQGPAAAATLEMHLAEYKAVNGIRLPHLVTRGANGQTNEEWEIKGYKINPNFKAGTFTK